MKKTVFTMLVAGVVAFSLMSCGPATPPKPKIGAVIYKYDDTFMSYVRNQIEAGATAVGKDKLDFTINDGQGDQSKVNDIIDLYLTQGSTALAINMVEPAAANVVIGKASAKKVPIVFFNREPDAAELAKYDAAYYVGAKAQESGTMEGQIIADYWKAHPEADKNKDGKLQYVMLLGDPANTDAKYRTEFSIKAVEAAGIKTDALAQDTAMWERGQAQNKMQAWLAKFGDKIEAVFANNDDMALGAIEALKAAGYFKGKKYIPVVGVDATPPALDALDQGTLLGTVLNDSKNQGKATFELAYSLAQGQPAATSVGALANADGVADAKGHYIWVPYVKVTKDNYKDFKQ
jgi:methyl-galactoside transport system substrate-binding protein